MISKINHDGHTYLFQLEFQKVKIVGILLISFQLLWRRL